MARVHVVAKAQKDQGNCSVCDKPIPVGTPYKWAAPRAGKFARGHKIKAHTTCQFRASQLTTSEIKGAIYDAIESAEADIDAWDGDIGDLESILNSAAESVREAGEGAQEKADNIESGFGHSTSQSEELADRAQAIDSFADEIEAAAQFEEFDEDTVTEEVREELGEEATKDAIEEAVNAKRDEWRDEQRDVARGAFEGNPE